MLDLGLARGQSFLRLRRERGARAAQQARQGHWQKRTQDPQSPAGPLNFKGGSVGNRLERREAWDTGNTRKCPQESAAVKLCTGKASTLHLGSLFPSVEPVSSRDQYFCFFSQLLLSQCFKQGLCLCQLVPVSACCRDESVCWKVVHFIAVSAGSVCVCVHACAPTQICRREKETMAISGTVIMENF